MQLPWRPNDVFNPGWTNHFDGAHAFRNKRPLGTLPGNYAAREMALRDELSRPPAGRDRARAPGALPQPPCEHRDVVAAILHPDPRFSAPPRQVVVHLPWFMELRLATADGQSIAADKIAEQEEVLAIALSARTIAWEGKAGRVAPKLRPRRNRLRSGLCAPAVACWCSYSHGRTRRAAARCFPDSRHRASRDARFRFSRKALPLRKSARLCVGGPGVREG